MNDKKHGIKNYGKEEKLENINPRFDLNIDQLIEFLNELIDCDGDAIAKLIDNRVLCNEKLANHPTVQVDAYSERGKFRVGLLGILNGIFGIHPSGMGQIAANYELLCPECGQVKEKELNYNDECPKCRNKIVMGKLINFIKWEE